MSDIRILLAEDQTLVRDGLRTILELEPGMAVVGEAPDGEVAVQRALEVHPDVVLMDVQMPRRNGVEATALIAATRATGMTIHPRRNAGTSVLLTEPRYTTRSASSPCSAPTAARS